MKKEFRVRTDGDPVVLAANVDDALKQAIENTGIYVEESIVSRDGRREVKFSDSLATTLNGDENLCLLCKDALVQRDHLAKVLHTSESRRLIIGQKFAELAENMHYVWTQMQSNHIGNFESCEAIACVENRIILKENQ